MSPIFTIRQGKAEDINSLMRLINDLAKFEEAPEKVLNTPEQLLTDWQQHRSFNFLVAVADGDVVGISLFYPRYSTWNGRCFYLEDLYVEPQFRNHGIGLALIEATAEAARQAGASRLDWQVLDWNTSAVKFYEKLGAVVEKEWWNCKWDLT